MTSDPKRSSGFTLIELMVAVSIMMVSCLGLATMWERLSKNREKVLLASNLVALETSLTSALLLDANYTSAVRSELKAGEMPPHSLSFHLVGSSLQNSFDFNIKPGENLTFSSALQACTGFPSASCPIMLSLATTGVGNGFAFAYRLHARAPDVTINYGGTSSAGNPGSPFSPSDYTISIPYISYLSSMSASCPAGSGALGLNSLDATNGSAQCIYEPQVPCPSGTLPKKLRFDSATKRIEFVCGSPAKTASCPNGYVLNSIDTTTLDGDAVGTPNAKCVYQSQTTPTGPTLGPSKRITGQVCPPGYISTSTCSLTNISSADGTPYPNWCDSFSENCAGASESVSGPNHTRTIPIDICSSSSTHYFPANSGSVVLVNNGSGAGSVDCYVQRANQSWGATWDGDVTVQVRCALSSSIPELVNAN